jgi:hypothetical protein
MRAGCPDHAYILDRHFEAINDAARVVFGYGNDDHNCLITFFTSARYRAAISSWPDNTSDIVADFRAHTARFPDDPRFQRLATKLSEASPEFAELWSHHEVGDHPHGVKTLNDPDVGELVLEFTSLPIADRPATGCSCSTRSPALSPWTSWTS